MSRIITKKKAIPDSDSDSDEEEAEAYKKKGKKKGFFPKRKFGGFDDDVDDEIRL